VLGWLDNCGDSGDAVVPCSSESCKWSVNPFTCGNRHELGDGPTHRFSSNEATQVAAQRCTFPQKWSDCVAGDFGALAALASTGPGAAVLLYAWPHKTLWDQLRRCSGAWMRQIVDVADVHRCGATWIASLPRKRCVGSSLSGWRFPMSIGPLIWFNKIFLRYIILIKCTNIKNDNIYINILSTYELS
jgi:hypothetical protein